MLPTKFQFIWPSVSDSEISLNRPISNKNFLWWSCLLTDRDRMNNLYSRCVLPYNQASVYLDKTVSEEKIFKKSTNQKEKLPVVAMVITGSGQNVQSL